MKNIVILSVLAALAVACQNSRLDRGNLMTEDGNFNSAALFGGKSAKSSDIEAKSVVGIRILKKNGKWHSCTGFLMRSRLVVTSAHCVDMRPDEIRVYFTTDMNDAPGSLVRKVSDMRLPDAYTAVGEKDPWDIAILKLDRNAPANYVTVSLASKDFSYDGIERVRIAGFGATANSKETNATKGLDKIMRVGTAEVSKTRAVSDEILFLDGSKGSGLCSGDSGSGIFVEKEGKLVAIGVFEGNIFDGAGDEACAGTGTAVKLSFVADWIRQQAEALDR